MGVPRNHPFSIGFSVVNHPFWGTPILGSYRIEYFLDQWWFSWWFHSHVLFSTPGIGWWSPIRSIFFRWVVRRRSQVLGTFERMAPGYERCPDGSSMHTYAYTYAICIYICIYTLYIYMAVDQYLLIPFLVGWTSIYQLFWCSPGVQGFDTLPYIYI